MIKGGMFKGGMFKDAGVLTPGHVTIGVVARFPLDGVVILEVARGEAFDPPAFILHDMCQLVRPQLGCRYARRGRRETGSRRPA